MADEPPRRPPPTLAERLLGTGARGARAVAGATGVDRAAELALEEAIVGVIESEAVERALTRVLRGPAFREAVAGAVSSAEVERAVLDALDSELVDRVWERLLASDEAQKLVERIAQAPEVRTAVAYQGVGLIEDLGRQLQRAARRLDGVVEAVARGLFGRGRRKTDNRAGVVTRGVALLADAALMNGIFFVVSAAIGVAAGLLFAGSDLSREALAFGTAAWLVGFGAYLVFFWTLAGQTPGMRFLAIRLDVDGERRVAPRVALRRYLGLLLGALFLGLGLAAVAVNDRRRGLHDRLGNTDVVYEDISEKAPWARLPEVREMPEGQAVVAAQDRSDPAG